MTQRTTSAAAAVTTSARPGLALVRTSLGYCLGKDYSIKMLHLNGPCSICGSSKCEGFTSHSQQATDFVCEAEPQRSGSEVGEGAPFLRPRLSSKNPLLCRETNKFLPP